MLKIEIKTFPLHFTSEMLKNIKKRSVELGFKSIKSYIHNLIEKDIKKSKNI